MSNRAQRVMVSPGEKAMKRQLVRFGLGLVVGLRVARPRIT
jgi:hypothetical protein